MSRFTEQAITQAFLELLAERPMDKVTVTDIAKKCGVNRNTFYYHYRDIYDLLDRILKAEEERLIAIASEDFSTWTESFNVGISWAFENKEAIYHIYKSVNRDRLERYLFSAGESSARRFVEFQARDLDIPSEYVEDVVRILAATLAGLVLEWINGGMRDDPREFVQRAAVLMEGSIRASLERVAR